MNATFVIPGVFLLAYAGFAMLARAMDRHYRQLQPGRPLPGPGMRAGLRLTGWLLLAISFYAAMRVWGSASGAVAWFGVVSLTAGVLILTLAWRPAGSRRLRFTEPDSAKHDVEERAVAAKTVACERLERRAP